MLLRYLFLLLYILASLHAEITLDDISSKPTSRAKDFLIWQYIKQGVSSTEAKIAYDQSSKKNYKLNRLYAKKVKDPYVIYRNKCRKKRDLFAINDKKCFKIALSPYKTLAMSKQERKRLATKVKSPKFIKLLKIQNEPYSPQAYKNYPADIILKMFINTTASHRKNNLNLLLDRELLNHMASSNKIHYFIKMVISNNKLDKLQKSLLLLDSEKLNADDNFRLALFHLKFNKNKSALKHLMRALEISKKSRERDKLSFWLYLITQDTKWLNKLVASTNINIYTLYAHEKKNIKITNYFSSLPITSDLNEINLSDPFTWESLHSKLRKTSKEELEKLVSKYQQRNMLPVQSYITEKIHSYKIHSYIMPYDEYLSEISKDEKALVYAIMRQESNFIPSALSRSFALGLMQMMPFLVKAMSKDMKLNTSYEDMFTPKTNIMYALKHLEWMKKSLYHPLFMAYAYNGGMGFLRKHLRNTGAFSKGKYEPFLSMETMRNSQSREYGKRVLANYVMYKKILGEDVSIIHLFQILMDPKETDRFRK